MSELAGVGSRIYWRAALIGIGLTAMAWAGFVLPVFRRDAAKQEVAARILIGEDFSNDALLYLDDEIDSPKMFPYPAGLRNSAIIRLRRAELAVASRRHDNINTDLASLHRLLAQALEVTPTDSFLWLALFWTQNTATGYRPQSLEYLKMSYLCGPREGWIAANRNRLAIALFNALPTNVRAATLLEFDNLISYGYVSEAAKIFIGPGWNIRDLLIANVAGLPRDARESFNSSVAGLGYNIQNPMMKMIFKKIPATR